MMKLPCLNFPKSSVATGCINENIMFHMIILADYLPTIAIIGDVQWEFLLLDCQLMRREGDLSIFFRQVSF